MVERFRAEHAKDLASLPVDVLTVVEVRLKLDVIPFPDLLNHFCVDAAIVPDFTGIYVDADSYKYLEGKPLKHFNRLRFSLAHELGHILMHRDLAPAGGFQKIDDFWSWMRAYQADRYTLEQQANEFAGRLLVPIDRLTADFDAFSERAKTAFPDFGANDALRNAFCEQLGDTYGVSSKVVSMRLCREEIWPDI